MQMPNTNFCYKKATNMVFAFFWWEMTSAFFKAFLASFPEVCHGSLNQGLWNIDCHVLHNCLELR